MRNLVYLGLVVLISLNSCGVKTPGTKSKSGKEKTRFVLVETPYGNMKLKLYNETPKHRDNFLKLVEQGFYDSLLFHRVINKFMIQGGDPDSKNAPLDKLLGDGGPGYDIDAEFDTTLFHKKGALAAAREPDQVNPEKRSSGSQFYIVQGKTFTREELKKMEDRVNFPKRKELVMDYVQKPENAELKKKIDELLKSGAYNEMNALYSQIAEKLEPEYQKLDLYHYSEEQIETYSTLGGTPHLDQNYTVFGEVVEGLNVIDSIAAVKTNQQDRPLKDIFMKMKIVRK